MLSTLARMLALFILSSTLCAVSSADNLPPAPPPAHTASPTSIEAVLDTTNVPVYTIHTNFGSLGGKEANVVNGAFYNLDDSKIFVNGIKVRSAGNPPNQAVGLEFEVVETISNREATSSSVSARYVDPADIPVLLAFVDTMANVAQAPSAAGVTSEVTYQTPGGTTFSYCQNGSRTPDFEIANGTEYYDFQFNRLVDVPKFRDCVERAAKWVAAQ